MQMQIQIVMQMQLHFVATSAAHLINIHGSNFSQGEQKLRLNAHHTFAVGVALEN